MSENWRAIRSSFVSAWEYQGLKEFSSVCVSVCAQSKQIKPKEKKVREEVILNISKSKFDNVRKQVCK